MVTIAKTIRTAKQRKRALVTVLGVLSLWLLLAAPAPPAHASFFYVVNSTGDQGDANPGDGYCEVVFNDPTPECTLRAAIQESNANPASPEVIFFHIPGSGVHTITPNSSLPSITDAVTIDGYSQPGSSVNTLKKGTNAKLMIQLNGTKAGYTSNGLNISSPNVVVKGLVVNRFRGIGINVSTSSVNSTVEGNFVGTDPGGTIDRGNDEGVGIAPAAGAYNLIGGASPAARNLISGNGGFSGYGGFGIELGAKGNEAVGNLVGTQRDGKSPLGNDSDGVAIGESHNTLGGTTPGYANTIAFNAQCGVGVYGIDRTGNSILSNSIFSNKGLGIDLHGGTESASGATANDPTDADTGTNNLQNKPVLSSAKKSSSGYTVIKGKLNSTPKELFTVQFFSNPKGTNEGKRFLFSQTFSTGADGNVSFSFPTKKAIKVGQTITATATNTSTGDTSEFSAPKKVVAS